MHACASWYLISAVAIPQCAARAKSDRTSGQHQRARAVEGYREGVLTHPPRQTIRHPSSSGRTTCVKTCL